MKSSNKSKVEKMAVKYKKSEKIDWQIAIKMVDEQKVNFKNSFDPLRIIFG